MALGVFIACSAPPTPDYGPPGGLRGKAFVDDAGALADSGPAAPACTPDKVVDGGACAVSWSGFVLPLLQGERCMVCHANQPPTFSSDVNTTYADFRDTVKLKASALPYINPCSTDPAASTLVGNLRGTAGKIMPPAPQAPTAAGDIDKVETWVKCGAPKN